MHRVLKKTYLRLLQQGEQTTSEFGNCFSTWPTHHSLPHSYIRERPTCHDNPLIVHCTWCTVYWWDTHSASIATNCTSIRSNIRNDARYCKNKPEMKYTSLPINKYPICHFWVELEILRLVGPTFGGFSSEFTDFGKTPEVHFRELIFSWKNMKYVEYISP